MRSGRQERPRDFTPAELPNISIDDFTAVSHTTNSSLFMSAHPYIPGWVRIQSVHDQDHNTYQEEEIRRRRRQEVEPRRVRKFLRLELLTKTGHSDWDDPRVYRYELAKEPERRAPPPQPSVVVVAFGSKEPALEERQDRRVVTRAPGGTFRSRSWLRCGPDP